MYSSILLSGVGVADGTFDSYTEVTNITNCRIEAIRFVRYAKYISQARKLMPNDTDEMVRLATDLVK